MPYKGLCAHVYLMSFLKLHLICFDSVAFINKVLIIFYIKILVIFCIKIRNYQREMGTGFSINLHGWMFCHEIWASIRKIHICLFQQHKETNSHFNYLLSGAMLTLIGPASSWPPPSLSRGFFRKSCNERIQMRHIQDNVHFNGHFFTHTFFYNHIFMIQQSTGSWQILWGLLFF